MNDALPFDKLGAEERPAGRPLRTFVAAAISPAACEGLAAETDRVVRLEPHAKAVPAANLHVTLAFLGATDPEWVPEIEAALHAVAASTRAPSVVVEGLGAFPDGARPRVIWAGLRDVSGPLRLAPLASAIVKALLAIGCEIADPDRFHAHVTLARLEGRSPPSDGLKRALTSATLQRTYLPEVLSDLRLMVSERWVPDRGPGVGRETTRYRPLAVIPLLPP